MKIEYINRKQGGMVRTTALFLVLLFISATNVQAETNTVRRGPPTGFSPFVQGGSVYNFKTDLDSGNDFSVNRYYIEGGLAYLFSTDRIISLSAGFGQDDYHFSNTDTAWWNNIDSYRLSAFVRWGLSEEWALFAAPSIRAYAEEGASHSDGWSSGIFLGASYTFSDTLTIGPAFAMMEQLEDDPLYFPILLIDWKITNKLSLGTGSGLGATQGPGLALRYDYSKKWQMAVSGRYESKRFRLNKEGVAPNGIGEDSSTAMLGSVVYNFNPAMNVSALLGYNFGGKLRLETESGNYLSSDEYSYSPFAGLLFSVRF